MVKETGRKVIAQNRKARHDYAIEDVFEAGLVLQGTEVKSLREGRASIVDAYGRVRDGEIWLEGLHIPEYTQGTWTNHEPRRTRKLLLHRKEIDRLIGKTKESGLTSSRSRCTSRTVRRRVVRSRWREANVPTTSGRAWRPGTRPGRSRGLPGAGQRDASSRLAADWIP